MRSHALKVWGTAAAALLAASVAGAQSLGELAAREQERREKERQKRGGASKVITESDLKTGGRGTVSNAGAAEPGSAPETAASPDAKASPEAPKEKSADEVRSEQESDWRKRIGEARATESRLAAELEALQRQLNDLTAPLYGSARTNALGRFDTVKVLLDGARAKIGELEEEGRRNSYR